MRDREPQTLKAGAEDVLRSLAARGIQMALVTNGPRAKQESKVERLGLEQYISRRAVVYADGVQVPRKPNPAPIREALRLTGADPATAYYVGDRISDVVAAHLARVAPVLVKSPSLVMDPPASSSALEIEAPLYTIERLTDLVAILGPDPAGLSRPQRRNRISARAS
jgi:phosphoglycolate phosphatase-like HAD superfamily hydrolase